jgi:hypothetical protein
MGPTPTPTPKSVVPSARAPAAPKAPKKAAEKDDADSPVRRLQLRYAELLATNLEVENPEFNWPKAGAIFKRLLDGHDEQPGRSEADVLAALEKFMADHGTFCIECRWTIGGFSARFNQYISDPTPVTKGRNSTATTTRMGGSTWKCPHDEPRCGSPRECIDRFNLEERTNGDDLPAG